jgi:hypothetical protein
MRFPAVVILVLVLLPAWAAAETCPPPGVDVPEPSVELSTGVADTVWHNDASRRDITDMAGNAPAEGMYDTGLTRTGTQLRLNPEVWWVELGDGRSCLGLGRVEADWRMEQVEVDIAAEYAPGSCQYRVVHDHESQHVALTRRTFDAHFPRMRARLAEAVRAVRPRIVAGEPEVAGRALSEQLMAVARPVLEAYDRERARVNAAIDTPENYRRTSALCDTW